MKENGALKITNLTKEYGAVRAVDNISFHVNAGEVVGLLGPNGAGKTTIINMVLGILEPTGGSIRVLDKELAGHRSEVSREVNFAAVYAHMPANLTVMQNLRVFGMLYEVKALKEKIEALLREFDLEEFAGTKAGLLSSGELSRLNLAKAVINRPRLLLLDEPTASLDGDTGRMIIAFVKENILNENRCILIVTHDARINEYADRIMHMEDGRLTAFEKGTE